MERPAVLLAMADNGNGLAADLGRAGFDTLTDSAAALATLTGGGRVDLAVIDCDLPAETTQPLYAAIHGAHRGSVRQLVWSGAAVRSFSQNAAIIASMPRRNGL